MSRDAVMAIKVFLGASVLTLGALFLLGPGASAALILLLLCGVLATVVGLSQRIRGEIESRYRRTEALLALYSVIEPKSPLPAPRVYMASPELLRAVAASVIEIVPQCVLELGGGVSTLIAAYALQRNGSGRIVSLDHDEEYVKQANRMLRAHKLDHVAKVLHAPLTEMEVDGQQVHWYDTKPLAAEKLAMIDLLIVDGPPGKDQPMARYPALPVLVDRLSPRAWVLIDDASRPDETEMVRRWANAYPRFEVEALPTEKGTTYLKSKA
jgi:predicted O-methyltransferase YrrM